jgi:hypothetical protein
VAIARAALTPAPNLTYFERGSAEYHPTERSGLFGNRRVLRRAAGDAPAKLQPRHDFISRRATNRSINQQLQGGMIREEGRPLMGWIVMKSLAVIGSIILLCACAQNIDPSFVAQRWSETLSGYNIDSVFPPRVLNVGDIFLVSVPPEGYVDDPKRTYSRRSMKLATIDVRPLLKSTYQNYLQIPKGNAPTSSMDIFAVPPIISRVPPTAYPGFSIVNITQGELGAAFPINIFKVFFGAAFANELAMSISIPDAEDIELPGLDAYDAIVDFCNSPTKSRGVCYLNSARMQYLLSQISRPGDPPNMRPFVLFIQHVYYANSIDYSYATSNAVAASVAAQAAVASGGTGAKTQGTSPTNYVTPPPQIPAPPEVSTTVNVTTGGTTTINCVSPSNPASAPASQQSRDEGGGLPPAQQPGGTPNNAPGAAKGPGTPPAAQQPSGGPNNAANAGGVRTNPQKGAITTSTDPCKTTTSPAPRNTSTPAPTSTTSVDATARKDLAAVQAQLSDLQQKLAGVGAGGMLTIASVTEQGTVLQQTFPYPIAIGYRALWIEPQIAQ